MQRKEEQTELNSVKISGKGALPLASIKLTRQLIDIGLYILIRPRGGDFVYSELEFDIMKEDIAHAKELGVDGIVSGVLLLDGNVDIRRTSELIELSTPLPFTFHRAFDLVDDYEKALKDVISCGAQRILTSGLANSSLEGINTLKNLNAIAKGQIIIMPGGGITQDNINRLAQQTGCKEFHCSAKSKVLNESSGDSLVKMNGAADISEGYRFESNTKTIAQIIQKLNEE